MMRNHLDALFLFQFTLILISVLPSWISLAFEFLLGISETFLCSMSAPRVRTAHPLNMNQLLMLFAGTLTYSETRKFSLIIFYNMLKFLLLLLLLHVRMYVCMYEYYPFSLHNALPITNILILIFSPVNDNVDISWIITII
jgi:hypothetical protein